MDYNKGQVQYIGKQKNIDEAKQQFQEAITELGDATKRAQEVIIVPSDSVGRMIFRRKQDINAFATTLGVRVQISLSELTITGPAQKLVSVKNEVMKLVQTIIQNYASRFIDDKKQCELLAGWLRDENFKKKYQCDVKKLAGRYSD